MAKFKLPKLPKLPDLATLKSRILTSFKNFNLRSLLPSKEQIKSPTGLALSVSSVLAIVILVVAIASLNPQGSSSNNGNGRGDSSDQNSSDQATDDANQPQASRKPISGPLASEMERDAAAEEKDRAIRAEKARLANLDQDDQVLIMMKMSLESYLAVADLAAEKGGTEVREQSLELKSAAKKILAEVESIGASRKLEWPKLGVEITASDIRRGSAEFLFPASQVESFRNSTNSDFDLAFNYLVITSVTELVDFGASRDMPDGKGYTTLTKLISTELSGLAKASKN